MAENLESLLVADIGSINTKLALVDRVGEAYRFVGAGRARTTAEPPEADVMVGIRHAAEQIQTRTNRRLLTEDQQLMMPERISGQGVDGFAAITSAGLPLRVAIVGLSRDVSVASATRAVYSSTYATIVATLALDETGGRWRRAGVPADGAQPKKPVGPAPDPATIAAEALARANPEVIILVGGIDGGATTALYEIANLIASITASRDEGARPTVIFAGNREARLEIAARIAQVAPLRVVDNIHPALERENASALRQELEQLYAERKIARLPGLPALATWSPQPVLPAIRSFENVIRFLSRRYNLDVLGADLGGGATAIVSARGETHHRVLRADASIGYNLQNVITEVGVDALLAWLPFEMNADEVWAHALNHSLRPSAIPITREEARLFQAGAREALALAASSSVLQDATTPDLIVLSGGMAAQNSDLGALALVVLDALQPRGVFTLAVDTLGLAPAFGALATVNPEAAASVVERDAFLTLGTVIAPMSNNHEGQVDLRVTITPAGSGTMSLEVNHGSLELIPLALGQKAALEIRASPGVNLGPGRRGVFKADVEGGALGLVIDARGRPLALPTAPDKRREKNQQWLWDVGSG